MRAKLPAAPAGVKPATRPAKWNVFRVLLRHLTVRRDAPYLVGEPFEPLLRVVELRGGHLLGPPGAVARVREQLAQRFPQRPVATALRFRPRAHAVWIPSARSSAFRNSSAV